MVNRQYTDNVRLLFGAVVAAYLWLGVSLAATAQHAVNLAGGEAHTVGAALHSSRPQLDLARMARVGPRAASGSFVGDESISDREQLAFADATSALLSRLSRPGHANALVQTARFAARLIDAPNHALCRLTGADRARLDLRRRRVSFTWFVSW